MALTSAHAFIRALKAPADPPRDETRTKIELASDAWHTSSLYIPSKDEILVEWLLSQISRRPLDASTPSPALVDVRYWLLLGEILHSAAIDDKGSRQRLAPILHRSATVPVLTEYLDHLCRSQLETSLTLSNAITDCYAVLWPWTAAKARDDALLDAFWALLRLCAVTGGCTTLHMLRAIVDLLLSQVRKVFAASTSKRKISANFIADGHFVVWTRGVTSCNEGPACEVHEQIFSIVSELLFNQDNLRVYTSEGSTANNMFGILAQTGPLGPPVFVHHWLSRLFASFAQNVKRNRASLLAASSSQGSDDMLQHYNTVFLQQCTSYLAHYPSTTRWPAFVTLLQVVAAENLYRRGPNWSDALSHFAKTALAAVDDIDDEKSSIPVLTALLHLDYDIIAPIVADILQKIVSIETVKREDALAFALGALDYSIRTRTVQDHVLALFESVKFGHTGGSTVQLTYSNTMRGLLFNTRYSSQLHSAVTIFLSPGQTSRLLQELSNRLRIQLGLLEKALDTASSSQKSKSSQSLLDMSFAIHLEYATFVFVSAISRSLSRADGPSHTASVNDLARVLHDFDGALQRHWSLRSGRWQLQTLQASSLRCRQMLTLISPTENAAADIITLVNRLFSEETIVTDLRIQLDNNFFALLPEFTPQSASENMTMLLNRLESSLDPYLEWDGQSCAVVSEEAGPRLASTAAISALLLRWLPNVVSIVDQPCLERVAGLVLQLFEGGKPSSTNSARAVVYRALEDASLWELHRLAECIGGQLLVETACFADLEIGDILHKTKKGKKRKAALDAHQVRQAVNAFAFTLIMPVAALGRATREQLVLRACVADVLLSMDEDISNMRSGIRNCIAHQASLEMTLSHEAIEYLINTANIGAKPSNRLIQSTVQLGAVVIERYSRDGPVTDLLLNHFNNIFENSSKLAVTATDQRLIVAFFGQLAEQKSFSPASKPTIEDLLRYVGQYLASFQHLIQNGLVVDAAELPHNFAMCAATMRLMSRHNLEFSVPRDLASSTVEQVETLLLTSPESELGPLTDSALTLLALETSANCQRASILVAAFITWARRTPNRWSSSEQLHSALKDFSPAAYESLLEAIRRTVAIIPSSGAEELRHLFEFATIVSRSSPENVAAICREQTRFYLSVFINKSIATHSASSVRVASLRLMEQICRERPMSLQLVDVGSICTFFSRLLAPTTEHDEATSAPIFDTIVSVLTMLVRLRQDLVTAILPHLTHLLRLLLAALQVPRPHLGPRQLREVSDRLPRFVSVRADATGSLDVDSATILARLFSALISKTTAVQHFGRSAHKDTAASTTTSLVKPLTHHAPAVLLTYLEILSAPLSMLSLDVRNKLEPGIFALCAACGERGRDSIMAGTAGAQLDSSSKLIFKTLWRDFEKQKYVGTG